MKYGPDISIVASMIGDPARTNMLMALMSGRSLPAAELAREAGVTASTASVHLAKLEANGLIKGKRDGRFRHFHIADLDVADAVEALIIVAGRVGHLRTRPGPRDEAMRRARTCYDHLAGRLAVDLFAHWISLRVLRWRDDAVHLTGAGERFLGRHGIDVEALTNMKRPLCRTCMDWSERRSHLGGSLGAAILAHVVDKRWAAREPASRVVKFGPVGERKFTSWYRELA
ncbi:MAG: helix-turn-helix transcriptional regulator [Hyphomicrobiales bacterium]|nr:helix-turn-helix transcriptional regulator [Hyphomicrobiales bacterium]MBV9741408.1 helix-turn-helix transcriptional regulator [Hyphomicrobiales bacterium]